MKYFGKKRYVLHNHTGFTLLETILYLALTSFILTTLFGTFYAITVNQTEIARKSLVEEDANFILKKIEWVLEGSIITEPAIGTTTPALVVTKQDYGSNPITIDDNQRNIRIQLGSADPLPLNNNALPATELSFQQYLPYATSSIVLLQTSFMLDGKLFSSNFYVQK
ncbi:MAG: hypothetical protein KGI50_04330 [Patescibacteria group bacterium]|nr:hypothetical protein [Patescibacteria group bacterium]MDE2438487.1 hypothetical protein [Patescibacteria group bacterium]